MDLMDIRKKIDELDEQLVELLAERMKLIPKVAEIKKERKISIDIPERVKEIIFKKKKKSEELNLNPEFIEDVFKRIIQESVRLEKEIIEK